MKKELALAICFLMICISISGAAISVNNTDNTNDIISEKFPINKPTESSEVNTKLLNNINQAVNEYLNCEKYETINPVRTTPKEIEFPWGANPLPAGDFVQWIIEVNYNDKYFDKELDINPTDFKDRFLDHPWHYESVSFDVDEDGTDDVEVHYSIFTSNVYNTQENIDSKSVRTCLKVYTYNLENRTAKLEVWSKIKLNYGLLKARDRPYTSNSIINSFIVNILQKFSKRIENIGFTPIKNFLEKILGRFQTQITKLEGSPDKGVLADDNDYISLGIGVSSPEGETIPLYMEKYFNVAKDNIFSPAIFETELRQTQSKEPLQLLFGFRSFKAGSSTPTLDVAFGLEFDPAIAIKTQFIPADGYVYYGYDSDSGNSHQTKVTFISHFIAGIGENIELSLIFDNTTDLANTNNWMSFDLHLFDVGESKIWGFDYKANKEFNIGLLLTSPVFSTKVKLTNIPKQISHWFDADLNLIYEPGVQLDATASASMNLDMSSDLGNFIIYYPKLSENEPDIEFIKVSDIPAKHKFEAESHLYVNNGSTYTTIMGEGFIDFTMSSNLGSIKMFYPKAEASDPDKLFVDVPLGLPASQRVGAKMELYINPDNFTDLNNYIFGRAYRTASGNIQEISGYLPWDQADPIVSITQIPSNSEAEGKLEWSKLKGYAHAARYTTSAPDPIEINIDLGTFNLNNYLEIRDGNIDLNFYLNQDGYFGFDTGNDMLNNEFQVTDTSTGNQLSIQTDDVDANDLWADWQLNLDEQPIQVEQLDFGGELSVLEGFGIQATYQGKYLSFDMDWHMGQTGAFAIDFNQDQPVELVLDDLFPDNPKYDLGGGVIISQDFHFDIAWNWVEGQEWGDFGYFMINQYSNNPNFDWIGLNFSYTPDGYSTPQYGVQIGGTDIGVIVYLKWWKAEGQYIPSIWWYWTIQGNFYLHLLWNGVWYNHVEDW